MMQDILDIIEEVTDYSLKLTNSCIFLVNVPVSAESMFRILSKLLLPSCDERGM